MITSPGPGGARGGGRSWLAALLASSALLLVAAAGLVGGLPATGGSAGPVDLGDLGDPSGSTPSPTATAASGPVAGSPGPARRGDAEQPRWRSTPSKPPAPDNTPLPRRLVVPRLGVDMPVVPTGVVDGGAMALPERPSTIGWYRYGPRPGDSVGSAVLAGHVDSREYGIGPLAALGRLRAGDRIVVERSGGSQTYEVRKVVLISKRAIPLDDVFERSGPANLRIVTCGGPYDRARGGYRDNLVVTAVPL